MSILFMKKILLYFIFISLFSCSFLERKNGIEFKIENNSNSTIRDLKFFTSERTEIKKFENIQSNQNIADFLNMTKNKSDGHFILEFTKANGKKVSRNYGYYTNGKALEKEIKFEIENDTIFVKFN